MTPKTGKCEMPLAKWKKAPSVPLAVCRRATERYFRNIPSEASPRRHFQCSRHAQNRTAILI